MEKQPYDNPTCEEHRQPYLWDGEWWVCGENKHPMPKVYYLIRNETGGKDWSEWSYDWILKEPTLCDADIALTVPEDIYLKIMKIC